MVRHSEVRPREMPVREDRLNLRYANVTDTFFVRGMALDYSGPQPVYIGNVGFDRAPPKGDFVVTPIDSRNGNAFRMRFHPIQ